MFFIVVTNFSFKLVGGRRRGTTGKSLFADNKRRFRGIGRRSVSSGKGIVSLLLPIVILVNSTVNTVVCAKFLNNTASIIDTFTKYSTRADLVFTAVIAIFIVLFLCLPQGIIAFGKFVRDFIRNFGLVVPTVKVLVFT